MERERRIEERGRTIISTTATEPPIKGTWDEIMDYMGNAQNLQDGKGDLSRTGNLVTFAPFPEGFPSILSVLMLAGGIRKLSESKEGLSTLRAITVKYLDTVGKIVSSMQHASAQNWLTALINQWSCTNIYRRLGMISPRDQFTTRLYLNHIFAEMLKLTYIHDTLGAATTIVTSTNESKGQGQFGPYESAGGLATLAKVFK